ncbi:hypothetical protein MtrunA17_Chr8g0373831 [Medicago truncatula]|uniref:Transmembrane protein n=1 Tax=Medicago truncatula TaxID=3880 RepID=A0A396GMA0_MEDTR|nr:hypothetical protein MtrunA17_Chr8g0373831 [Medicago truncatula]
MFIFSFHAVNAFHGCASFSWPHIPPTLDVMAWLKLCGLIGLLIVQGTVMASAISLVEEMLFRSWNHNFRAGIFFCAEEMQLYIWQWELQNTILGY